ncbi:MAG: hypothetical protein IT459_21810 [Planctomycetes bacterium]|nr:hypothetical protein [Planctomycetota bacterium]
MAFLPSSVVLAVGLFAQVPASPPMLRELPLIGERFENARDVEGARGILANARVESHVKLPGGRDQVRFLIDESTMQPVTESTPDAPRKANPLETWLVDRVTKAAPRLEFVRVQHSEQSQLTATGSTRTAKTWLEFAGPEDDVKRSCELLTALAAANREHVVIDGLFATKAWSDDESAEGGVRLRFLSADEAKAVRADLMSGKAMDVLTQPSVVTGGGQRAMVSIVSQTSYVADFEVQVVEDSLLVDPIVKVVQEGLMLDLCPIIDADSKTIHLQPRIEIDVLQRPIREFKTTVAGMSDVTIQIPFVEKVRWEPASIELAPPHVAVLVSGLRSGHYDEDGDRTETAMTVMLMLTRSGGPGSAPDDVDAVVGWYDREQRLAAATLARGSVDDLVMDEPVEIRSDAGVVQGTLIGWLNETVFIRAEHDAVEVGNTIRFVNRRQGAK